ncbi:MAG: hypothetical protein ACI9W1_001063 [Candidatus Azotimanducaceae bacterium]|jgi:hypothetical protein
MKSILANCTLIDCTGATPQPNMSVTAEDNRITDIKPRKIESPTGGDSTPTSEFNKREFELMAKVGIDPVDVLTAGTRTSPELYG